MNNNIQVNILIFIGYPPNSHHFVTGDPNSNPHGQSTKSRERVYRKRDTIYADVGYW